MMFLPILVQAQAWQYTGAMNSVRWLSEMVVLDNQTALIAGGYDYNEQPLATCEIYDPATASWTLTGSLNVARAYPILVKLPNGHVLSMCGGIAGGSGEATNVVEDYNPGTGLWTTAGVLNIPRFVPSAILLQNGKILVAGGLTNNGTTASCELYDPQTQTSTLTGSMLLNRYCCQAVRMDDGTVLLTGGRDGGAGSNYFGECELYDPSTETWAVASSMQQARTMGVLTRFSDNSVLAAGGRNAHLTLASGSEILDPITNVWQSTSAIKEPIHWTAGIGFPDDRFMATGGIVDANLDDPAGLAVVTTSMCEWYDRTLQLWYFAPELNYSRCRHNAAYIHQIVNKNLPIDLLLVAGGQKGNATRDSSGIHIHNEDFTNTAEILDVTPAALKAYMKHQPLDVQMTQKVDNTLSVVYKTDGSINVDYTLVADEEVSISIINISGQIVKQLSAERLSAGDHSLHIQTSDLSTGTYFVHLTATNSSKVFKFFVAK